MGQGETSYEQKCQEIVSQAATGYIQAKEGQTEERPRHSHLISREHF